MANKMETYSEFFEGPVNLSFDMTEAIDEELTKVYNSGWGVGKLGVSVDVEKISDTEYIIRNKYDTPPKVHGLSGKIISRNEYVFTLTAEKNGLLVKMEGEYNFFDTRARAMTEGIEYVMPEILRYREHSNTKNSAAAGKVPNGLRYRGPSARKTYKGGRRRKTHKRGRKHAKKTHKRR